MKAKQAREQTDRAIARAHEHAQRAKAEAHATALDLVRARIDISTFHGRDSVVLELSPAVRTVLRRDGYKLTLVGKIWRVSW